MRIRIYFVDGSYISKAADERFMAELREAKYRGETAFFIAAAFHSDPDLTKAYDMYVDLTKATTIIDMD